MFQPVDPSWESQMFCPTRVTTRTIVATAGAASAAALLGAKHPPRGTP
jgi:hypothetical protein